ncbi:MAG TPA: HIT family hydrolase [Anaerolineaceae bacterium]|nr:HIT family hydrolase [Anaerolineaceae bacterium]
MEHVWAPWRMKYIQEASQKKCFFCEGVHQQDSIENLVVKRGKFAFVMLNRYPYTSGHLMVVPYEHKAAMKNLSPETKAEMMQLITEAIQVLEKEYGAEGFNVGANLGAIAGAGVADHLHFHVVPRWNGDTNFMTSVGNARVLPENLPDTFQRIKNNWPSQNI